MTLEVICAEALRGSLILASVLVGLSWLGMVM